MLNYKSTLSALLLSLLLFACEKPVKKANAGHIKNLVTELASDEFEGRGTATEGEKKASDLIIKEFELAGLTGYKGKFLHPFDFNMKVELSEGNTLLINGKELKLGEEFMPLSYSGSKKIENAELLFAGYGIEAKGYNDYKRKKVSGRVVVIEDGFPDKFDNHSDVAMAATRRNKVRLATEKGAAAIIFVSKAISAELESPYTTTSVDLPVLSVKKDILEPLRRQRRKHSVSLNSALNRPALISNNVIGVKQGELADKYIVLGAHYDHLGHGKQSGVFSQHAGMIHNGADDNASGTAALMELAHKFNGVKTKYSIVFMAFSGEELGLLGAREIFKQKLIDPKSIVAMFNMDMVGRLNAERELTIYGTGTGSTFIASLDSLNKTYGFTIKGIKYTPGNSDHHAFYKEGVPVLFFNTGLHGDYHRPSDDANLINAEGIAQIADFVGDVIVKTSEKDAPAFAEVEEPNKRKVAPFKVYIGTNPDYAYQGKGLYLTGTSKGSPAEAAGLIKNDIIVAIDGKKIDNVYDYMGVLGGLTAGKEVDVKAKRDGKEITLKLTPAPKRR